MILQEGIAPKPNRRDDPIRRHRHTAILCFNVNAGTTKQQLLQGFQDLATRIAIISHCHHEEGDA